MRVSGAHIAGVGIARGTNNLRGKSDNLTVFAATKALLDAGVTYDDVDLTVACFHNDFSVSPQSFEAFGKQGAPIARVHNSSGILAATQAVRSRESNCVLLVSIDIDEQESQSAFIGLVLVSDHFLTSHAYLKDGAITISGYSSTSLMHSASIGGADFPRTVKTAVTTALRYAQIQQKDIQVLELRHSSRWNTHQALEQFDVAPRISTGSDDFTGITGSLGLCSIVWQLRGWANNPPSKALNCLQMTLSADGMATAIVLRRADGRSALTWDEVKNVRDGRERLGYNPAAETRDISREDLLNVSAKGHFIALQNHGDTLELAQKGGDRAALARL